MNRRLKERPRFVVVVAGPRQVGKTTLVKQALNERASMFVSADQPIIQQGPEARAAPMAGAPATAEWLRGCWLEARRRARSGGADGHRFVLAVDEIQKIPRWSEVVKGLWDEDRAHDTPLHVVILGSSPWLMQKGLTESLAGRFEVVAMTHWAYAEMQRAFDFSLEQYIYFGGYPGSADLVTEGSRWREYVVRSLIHPIIHRDILETTRVDKPALLRCLFELACGEYSGQIVAYTKLVGELQDAGNTTTLAHYIDLLSKAGLLTGLSKYADGAVRQCASMPKLNVHNMALFSAQSRYTFAEARADRSHWGRLVESAVGAHLLNSLNDETRLHYWQVGNDEVDFVLTRGKQVLGIEVKSGRHASTPKGVAAFRKTYPRAHAITVGGAELPLQEFLLQPPESWLR